MFHSLWTIEFNSNSCKSSDYRKKLPTKIYEFYEDTQDILNLIDTKYVFFAHNHYDFDRIEANFERMIREAENQNADIVTGISFNHLQF